MYKRRLYYISGILALSNITHSPLYNIDSYTYCSASAPACQRLLTGCFYFARFMMDDNQGCNLLEYFALSLLQYCLMCNTHLHLYNAYQCSQYFFILYIHIHLTLSEGMCGCCCFNLNLMFFDRNVAKSNSILLQKICRILLSLH